MARVMQCDACKRLIDEEGTLYLAVIVHDPEEVDRHFCEGCAVAVRKALLIEAPARA